jgi:hypothetical protein
MQLPQLCVARRHSFNAPQHETVLTSLRSLHKVMASMHAIATNTAFASAPGRANGITIAGPSAFQSKNPTAPAVKREAEEDWGR